MSSEKPMPDLKLISSSAVYLREIGQLQIIQGALSAERDKLKGAYADLLQEEYRAFVQSALGAGDFRNCARPEARKLAEQLRAVCAALERIQTVEIPNAIRYLEQSRIQEGHGDLTGRY